VERIVARYADEQRWLITDLFTGTHSYVRTRISGNDIEIVYETPSESARQSGISAGLIFFKGTGEGDKIKGRFTVYAPGCPNVEYEAEGNFVENNAIFFVGRPPLIKECRVTGLFPPTLRTLKNTSDWGFKAPP
jgi:hypothetical protein